MQSLSDRALAAAEQGNGAAALDLARQAGETGEARGWGLLGYWALSGQFAARDLVEARRLFRLATEGGDADAALTEVALTANGTGGPSDFRLALQRLREAARRFGGAAAEDLALIEAMDLDADGYPSTLAPGKVLCDRPLVRLWHNFVSPDECAHIAALVQDILEPSMVADPRTGRQIAHPIRDSLAAPIGPTRETLPIQAILRRIARASGTEVDQGESLTVLRYAPGQQYREHVDTLPHAENQRKATMILYLNQAYTGGATTFSAPKLAVQARGGDAVLFHNTTAGGQPDPLSRHAGQPVQSGSKWIATRWIRQAPYDVWSASS